MIFIIIFVMAIVGFPLYLDYLLNSDQHMTLKIIEEFKKTRFYNILSNNS